MRSSARPSPTTTPFGPQAEHVRHHLGKAQLIQQIAAENSRYTFADLVPLSINELNLLRSSGASEREAVDSVQSVGDASDKAYIGAEKAKKAAFDPGLESPRTRPPTCR